MFTDEDRADPSSRRSAPRFKPDYSPDAMQAADVVGGLIVYRTGPLAELGSLDPAALALLAKLGADPRAQVLPLPGAFNFSAMNNAAAPEGRSCCCPTTTRT
jgi:hypothetical protein